MAAAAPQRATAEAAAALRALPRGSPLYRGGATRRTSSAGGGGPALRDPRVARGGLSAMPCRGGGTSPPPPAGPGRGAGPGLRRRHQGLTTRPSDPSGAEGRPAGRVRGAAAQACGGTGREAPAAARAGQLRPRESRKMAAGGRVALRRASGPGSRRRPLRADGGAAVGGPGSGRRPVRSREGGRGGTGDGGGHGGDMPAAGCFLYGSISALEELEAVPLQEYRAGANRFLVLLLTALGGIRTTKAPVQVLHYSRDSLLASQN